MLEGRLAGWLALSSMLTRSCRVAVEGSRQEEEGGERGELLPFYPINTRIPIHQSFIPCPCPCRLILLTTNLHTPLKPWPSTNIPTTKSTLLPKHSNKSPSPHASGLKVSCRRSHHHLSRPALWIDCGSTGTWTALAIYGSTLLVAVLLSPRPVTTTYTVYHLPLHHQPTRLLSNHERCITQTVSSPSACHCLSILTWSSEARLGLVLCAAISRSSTSDFSPVWTALGICPGTFFLPCT